MITLTQPDDPTVNIELTNYIIRDSDPVVMMEWERDAFERVVEDVTLLLDNSSRAFSIAFKGKPPTTVYKVEVVNGGRTIFRGRISNRTILFDLLGERVSFDIFSDLGDFWLRAQIYRVDQTPNNPTEAAAAFTTVANVMKREFVDDRNHYENGVTVHESPYRFYFTTVIVHSYFATSPIRGWLDAAAYSDPTIGNNGMFLHCYATHYELLKAFAVWYNAEFYIDYDLNALVMRPRYAVINPSPAPGAKPWELSTVARVDSEITHQLYNERKYDTIHYLTGSVSTKRISSAVATQQFNSTGFKKNVSFVTTLLSDYAGGITLESAPSPPTDVDVLSVKGAYTAKIVVTIPAFSGDRCKLYRTPQAGGDYRLVATFTNVGGTYTETTPNETTLVLALRPPTRSHGFMTWDSYNEATGKWFGTTLDTGTGFSPSQAVLDIVPILRFESVPKPGSFDFSLLDYSVDDVIAFFGLEATLPGWTDTIRKRYISEVSTKHLVNAVCDGTTYKLGDQFTISTAMLPDATVQDWMVKRAGAHIEETKDRTEIQLVNM